MRCMRLVCVMIGVQVGVCHEYVDSITGLRCRGGKYLPQGRKTDAECMRLCDNSPLCVMWQQFAESCQQPTTCFTYTKLCTNFTTGYPCSTWNVRATQVTPHWRVGCGDTTSNCCGVVGNCFQTMNYPNFYDPNVLCVASTSSGTLRGTGRTEAGNDEVCKNRGSCYEGDNIYFQWSSPRGPQAFYFHSNPTVQKTGLRICRDTLSPTVQPTIQPSLPPLKPTPSPTLSPTISPTAPPSTGPTHSPTT
eukprot:Hpha_TRINITY_DN27922_c0_g1::TRINITY_DN27922_c0_g1_i1::g.44971::m.44971